jgi:hypothetical protein
MVLSEQILTAVQGQACRGELAQLAEKRGVRGGEIEARLALHALLQLRRYFLPQRCIPIQGHEMEADVAPAGNHGTEEKRFAFVAGRARFEVIPISCVSVDMQMLRVGGENPLQRKKDMGEFAGSIRGTWCGSARSLFLGHRAREGDHDSRNASSISIRFEAQSAKIKDNPVWRLAGSKRRGATN